ncbi:MAG: hypothetical protein OEZ16_11155 [Chromatiales bacterium]|nr:hypothetical protein [Chromatiales bacterium]
MKMLLPAVLLLWLISCGGNDSSKVVAVTAANCDAAEQLCSLEAGELTVSLVFSPQVETLKPFSVHARIEGADSVDEVIVDIQMVGMEMGPNRYRLIAKDSDWYARVILPFCATSRSDWLAQLEFSLDDKHYRLAFPFTSR